MSRAATERMMALLQAATPRSVRLSERYTRFVGIAKVALPGLAVALTLLVIVLAWRDQPTPTNSFKMNFAGGKPGEAATGMTGGRFVGADEQQRPFTITANTVRPEAGDANRLVMRSIQADLTLDRGNWITLLSPFGEFDRNQQRLALRESVSVYSDDGFALQTSAADVDLTRGVATGEHPVVVQGPLGELRADSFRLQRNAQSLSFAGNVRMVVRPQGGR